MTITNSYVIHMKKLGYIHPSSVFVMEISEQMSVRTNRSSWTWQITQGSGPLAAQQINERCRGSRLYRMSVSAVCCLLSAWYINQMWRAPHWLLPLQWNSSKKQRLQCDVRKRWGGAGLLGSAGRTHTHTSNIFTTNTFPLNFIPIYWNLCCNFTLRSQKSEILHFILESSSPLPIQTYKDKQFQIYTNHFSTLFPNQGHLHRLGYLSSKKIEDYILFMTVNTIQNS